MMFTLRNFLGLVKPSVRVTIKFADKVIVRSTILCDVSWLAINEYQDYNVSFYEVVDGVLVFNITAPGYRGRF